MNQITADSLKRSKSLRLLGELLEDNLDCFSTIDQGLITYFKSNIQER